MDANEYQKCIYGKKHSTISINSDYDYVNLSVIEVEYCEVCGMVIRTESDMKNGKHLVERVTKKIPQIAKEALMKSNTDFLYQDGQGFFLADVDVVEN